MTKFAGGLVKIRSMTVDTNVVSDLLALTAIYGPALERGEKIPPHLQAHYDRCVLSKLAVFIVFVNLIIYECGQNFCEILS